MKYLATIVNGVETYSKSFNTIVEAERWLDMNNNNGELTTIIDEYNDKWQKVDGFFYTEAKNESFN